MVKTSTKKREEKERKETQWNNAFSFSMEQKSTEAHTS